MQKDALDRKTLHLFYIYDDVIRCRISNFSVYAYKFPQTRLNFLKEQIKKKLPELILLNKAGVYMLFGKNTKGKQSVYIGKAEARTKKEHGTLQRISEEHKSIDWNTAIVFTSSDSTWGSTDISYVEHKFVKYAQMIGRYDVTNDKTPSNGNPVDEEESALEEFINFAKFMLNALGHNLLESEIPSQDADAPIHSAEYCIKSKFCDAQGYRTDEGFVVMQGSKIRKKLVKSVLPYVKTLREDYKKSLKETKKSDTLELKSDLFFDSSTAAASFVCGNSCGGPQTWKEAGNDHQ